MLEKLLSKIKSQAGFINESTISFVLGVLVVAVSAFIAYSYFHQKAEFSNLKKTESKVQKSDDSQIPISTISGQLTPAASTVANVIEYTVQKDDTLWTISEKVYGTGFDWGKITETNPRVDPRDLVVGSKLTIISPTQQISQIQQNQSQQDKEIVISNEKITGDKYVIKHEDTLWNIALRAYGDAYKWPEIAKANNLSEPWIIHSGNILLIPR